MSPLRFLALVVVVWAVPFCGAPPTQRPAEMRVGATIFPAGDAQAGREAFARLHCYACHEVAGDDEMPPTVAAEPGPELGPAQAAKPQGELVSAIVTPSHSIVEDREEFVEGELSRMGDFTEVMTVRELVDLVAYLRSLGRTGGA